MFVFKVHGRSAASHGYGSGHRPAPHWLATALILSVSVLLGYLTFYSTVQAHASYIDSTKPVVLSSVNKITPAPKAKSNKTAGDKSGATPTIPECTGTTDYTPAGPLAIGTTNPGLHVSVDNQHYYKVYGYTVDQIRFQLIRCTPVASGNDGGKFAADTSYSINTAYNYSDASGQCKLSQVAVGVHVSEVFPSWSNTPYAGTGVASEWQSFVSSLQTHEHGHESLDLSSATKIMSDLQNFRSGSCANVNAQIKALVNRDINSLNAANVNYDTATNHGATQGAVLR